MIEDIVSTLRRDGYVVIEGAISGAQVGAAREALELELETTPTGRQEFEGRHTRRVYGLFGKTRTLDGLATHPGVLHLLDEVLGHYQLSAPTAISIGPGETAQPLHTDDGLYPIEPPHVELVVNVMWPMVEFTETNGATRIVPGSHRWTTERPTPDTETVPIELHPGSALVYLGSVWHGGGANRSAGARLGVVLHYCVGWLRPAENHVLVVPPEVAVGLDERLQELLGYNICPPFIGYVDGRHPRKVLDPVR